MPTIAKPSITPPNTAMKRLVPVFKIVSIIIEVSAITQIETSDRKKGITLEKRPIFFVESLE